MNCASFSISVFMNWSAMPPEGCTTEAIFSKSSPTSSMLRLPFSSRILTRWLSKVIPSFACISVMGAPVLGCGFIGIDNLSELTDDAAHFRFERLGVKRLHDVVADACLLGDQHVF